VRENPPVSIPPSRPAPVGAQGKPTLKDPQEIEDFLLYRLFRITHVGLRGTDDMYKRELGISRREWRILAYLARTPDASLKALAADAGIDVVVASRTVADMHSRGLVDKRRSPGNKRLVCLRLTDDGVQIHGKAKLMAAAYNRELAECLTHDEASFLFELLTKLERQAALLTRDR
jgi:DNA-binding MarR family transcriptional regulator